MDFGISIWHSPSGIVTRSSADYERDERSQRWVQGACDGTGACTTPGTKPCLPYACDSSNGACKSACTTDTDCSQGAKCDTTTGKCAITSATCKDSFALQMPNGQTVSCAPYKCKADACDTKCASTNDCADGYTCKATSCVESTGTGGAASGGTSGKPSSGDDGGCGCRVPARGRAAGAAWLAVLGLLAVLRRRRAV